MTTTLTKTQSRESFTDAARNGLFWISVLALLSTGMSFAIRTSIIKHLDQDLFAGAAGEKLGAAVSLAFLGFAVSILTSSPLLDRLGMGKLLGLSATLVIIGISSVILVGPIGAAIGIEQALSISLFVFGLGWGLVESVVNPLIATLYADDKTHKLNNLHAWWPAGLIIGGLIGYFSDHGLNLPWRVQLAIPLLPTLVYGLAGFTMHFPATERKAAGVADSQMFKELGKPMFLLIFGCMFLTAGSELAPNQWVDFALSHSAHMPGILLLVYVSALMFVMRHFAGPLAHKLSPVGLLWFSAILASIGLVLLSLATSPPTAIAAATVWGTGVCYMWPTMLAMTSERFPRGGSLLLGTMGSIFLVLPQLGKVYDRYAANYASAAGYQSFEALKHLASTGDKAAGANLIAAQTSAGSHSFQAVAILPAILILVFGSLWLYDRARGGYAAVRLDSEEQTKAG